MVASPEEIRKAYVKLSLKAHPDKCIDKVKGSEVQKKLNEAHEILHDPSSRRVYESRLEQQENLEHEENLSTSMCQSMSDMVYSFFSSCVKQFYSPEEEKSSKRRK